MFLNKSFSVNMQPNSGGMNTASCSFYLPFTSDNVSKLVLTVEPFNNYAIVKINGTQVYVGRRETINVDITSRLTTSITALTIEQNGTMNSLVGSLHFSTITTK